MRQIIIPVKDASVYSGSVNLNTGLDEILEIGKSDVAIANSPIRTYLQFDLTQFVNVPATASYELKLFIANAGMLNYSQSIAVNNVIAPWVEGTGYFGQDTYQIADGITWASQPPTGSLTSSVVVGSPVVDLAIDVTSIINAQLSGSHSGMMLQFPASDETDATNRGFVKVFSKDTHTIYTPTLTAKWNDQVYITGSLTSYPSTGLLVTPATLKPQYAVGEVARIDLSVRPAIPLKSFATQFTQYLGNSYLPPTSYFSVVDDQSNKVIVPFDDSSRINCDGTSAYFVLNVQNMYPRRFYRVKIKVMHDGLSEIFDAGYVFKVTD